MALAWLELSPPQANLMPTQRPRQRVHGGQRWSVRGLPLAEASAAPDSEQALLSMRGRRQKRSPQLCLERRGPGGQEPSGRARVWPGRAVLLREALESGGHHPQPPRSARTSSPPCAGHQPFLYKMSPMVTSEAWGVQGEERGRRQRVLILTPERGSRAARQP